MSSSGKIRALAATLRLPNLPSVWSNTLTGVVLAALIYEVGDLSNLTQALLSTSCLYLAGNLFNDWADQSWDEQHRPERALPSGVFSSRQYLIMGVTLTLIGIACASLSGPTAMIISLTLTGFILTYTWIHKRTAWSVIPMALCRASLPALGFFCCSERWHRIEWLALPCTMLFIYLILLSLRARSESRPQQAPKQTLLTAFGFLLPPLIIAFSWFMPFQWWLALIVCLAASIPYLIWTCLALTWFRKPIPRQVSALLAGIPLIDSLFLLPYLIMGFIFMPNILAQSLCLAWIPAFIAGRLLQRYVPAT